MNELEQAVKTYCEMLPNSSISPNDNERLYKISYWKVKLGGNSDDIKRYLLEYLPKNSLFDLSSNAEELEFFVENRLNEIDNGAYVISKIK